jgi:oxidoreductase
LANFSTTSLAIVASPNRFHEEQALTLLRQGIPVVIEKPVCMSAKGCLELEIAALEAGVSALRSCPSLYDPHFLRFKALFACLAPDLGTISRIGARWLRSNGIPASKWLTSGVYSMAGSSLDLGWHVLELVMAMLDYPSMTLVSTTFSDCVLDTATRYASWYGENISAPGTVDVDTAAILFLKTETGIDVELRTAWDADVANDEVVIDIEGPGGSLSLQTILGMSLNGPALPRIDGRVSGRAILEYLPPKTPGTAHNEMVERFVVAGFNPVILGQSWSQLRMMSTVAEQIVASHSEWRAASLPSRA